jgi:alpha-L-fucosidase
MAGDDDAASARDRILRRVDETLASGPFKPDWDSLAACEVPAWYRDGKFGIFVHWGPYSVPKFGNEWYPRNMYVEGSPEYRHHIETYGPQDEFGYKDFIPMFKAERFDAGEWAGLFKRAGAAFVVPVAEHHDGFQMYGSSLSRWNAAEMGPKRDVIGELADATRSRGMVFGLSSHRAEHWWFMNGGMKGACDARDPRFADFYGPAEEPPKDFGKYDGDDGADPGFMDDWLARTCELIDKYRPQLLWFDWWINHVCWKPWLKRLGAYYYDRAAEWGEGVAINYKYGAFEEGTAVLDIERGQFAGASPRFWQNDTSVSRNSWGHITGQDYKPAEDIIRDLVDVVAKNGALLLNVGPRADGAIPEAERRTLEDIGAWLAINGESVYGTRPWYIQQEGPTRTEEGAFTDAKRKAFTSGDIRYAAKGDALYATVLRRPDDGSVLLKALASNATFGGPRPREVRVLGGGAAPRFRHDGLGLRVESPDLASGSGPVVVKIVRG